MAKLTAARKAELKKNVLAEINKGDQPIVKKDAIKSPVIKVAKKRPVSLRLPRKAQVNPIVDQTLNKPLIKSKSLPKKIIKKSVPAQKNEILPMRLPVDSRKKVFISKLPRVSNNIKVYTKDHHRSNSKIKKIILRLLGIIILIFIIGSIDVFGIYKLDWRDGFSYQVAKILRLPAGKVVVAHHNGESDIKIIYVADFINDLKILSNAVNNDREGLGEQLELDVAINEKIFNRLVLNAVTESQLEYYNKSVTDDALESQFSGIITQVGSRDQAEKVIKDLYGLSIAQFKKEVLGPLLMKDLLQQEIINDASLEINQNARKKIEAILKVALGEGVDFNLLANQFTEDETGQNIGGDLGWVLKGELSKEIDDALFSLAPNHIYPQVVKSDFGYHILKSDEVLVNEDANEPMVHGRHILIKVPVDAYINQLMKLSLIKSYISI